MKRTFFMLSAVLLTACGSSVPETVHEHGPEPLVYTVYSEKTELFVEFQPLVVGESNAFAAHFTILGDRFTPMSEGTVTVSLVIGDKGIRQTVDAPASPGIYRLELTPVTTGTGQLIFDIVSGNDTDRIVIDNVTVYADAAAVDEAEPTGNSGEGEITYLKEQAWKIDFANQPVVRQPFYQIIKTSGQILPAPGDEVVVTATSGGIIFFTGDHAVIGSPVSKGEGIFLVSGAGLTEDNIDTRFKEARSDYEKAKADFERAQELIESQVISQKEFIAIQNAYEIAQARFSTLSRNYTSDGTKIIAPISGYLKNLYVTEGQFVQVGDPVASVSQNRRIMLQADVSQKYFSDLASIQSANFITPDKKVFNTADLDGRLVAFGKSTSNGNAFIPVTFEIDNRGEILPGSFVEVFLKTAPVPDALVVPVSALLEEQGQFYVYVQLGGESFTRREVIVGGNDGINAGILSGLSEGERVVTRGAYNIKLSVASGSLPAHGHEH